MENRMTPAEVHTLLAQESEKAILKEALSLAADLIRRAKNLENLAAHQASGTIVTELKFLASSVRQFTEQIEIHERCAVTNSTVAKALLKHGLLESPTGLTRIVCGNKLVEA